MFRKILIANRGEIACRVMKTAKRMGISTVAVYSEADAEAPHVEMADEAVAIGPAPAAQSYLVIENIIDAARKTGAQAIHPGYGFLSENAGFATALQQAGIAFIGPNVRAIEVMGDKIESKKFANAADVNTVPGYLGVIPDTGEAIRIAEEIGFPVMIKASAGGGGKGMRIAYSSAEVEEGFASSMSEARSSFGDDRVFIEKFIEDPRHIEIQVMADKHGNVIHLGERECSIQRRNQKVIEEAPSPFLDPETRAAMGAQAVALAKAVDYESAGTVEFIVDKARNFYFLEMNTRLQVEHPVTEMITGLDLVELMIRVAAGEKLPIAQDDVRLNGWAIESRIYAEDPLRNFLPSIGRLTRYVPPAEETVNGLTVRNDTGVAEGGEISMYYDPMIAKLITHGPDRASAIAHMARALDGFVVDGIRHNVPFLSALMAHPRWQAGDLTTKFIAEEFPEGFQAPVAQGGVRDTIVCAAAAIDHLSNVRRSKISQQMDGHRRHAIGLRHVEIDGAFVAFQLAPPKQAHGAEDPLRDLDVLTTHGATVILNPEAPDERHVAVASDWWPGQPLWSGTIDDQPVVIQVRPILNGYRLSHAGHDVDVRVYTDREAELVRLMPVKEAPDTSRMLLCPMPGLVTSIAVEVGAKVQAGDPLCTVEAMKMENVLKAEREATVKVVHAAPGESLAVDAVIMEFE